jgi:putative membrane protein
MRSRFLLASVAVAAGCLLAQSPGAQTPMGQSRPMPSQNPNMNTQTPDTTNQTTSAKVDDKKFAKEAAEGGLTEVALGKLAVEKGQTDAVKQFGQKMIDDHSKANDDLKAVASAQNIDIPDSLDSKHQAMVDKMSKLSGAAFDHEYSKNQLKDHEKDVREFQQEAQNGNNPAVKDFASKTLPTLQQHLAMAKDLNNRKMASNSADRAQQ